MNAQQIKEGAQQYLANTYGRFDLVLERGKGATVSDTEGKEYIDLGSGIGVNSLGFADEGWVREVTKQLGKLAHTSNLYYSAPCVELAKVLCTRTGMKKVFFCNSGAEANEGAIKAARKYSLERYGKGRHTIVSLQNSFHGRTMATLSATGQDVFHQNFDPFLEGFRFAPAGDTDKTLSMLTEDVCAVMIELIQGEGGVVPLERDYVKEVADCCKKRDILLLVDEVQTGIGRTGKLLCCEHYGLLPDIITLAKGLGGGLPIGAVLFGEKCENTLGPGDHGSTFGGNPAVCAGALAVLSRLDDAMLGEIEKKGAYLRESFEKLPGVQSVTGLGLMIGLQPAEGIAARDIVTRAIQKGAIPLTAKSKVRLLPPLAISWEELEKAAAILSECFEEGE